CETLMAIGKERINSTCFCPSCGRTDWIFVSLVSNNHGNPQINQKGERLPGTPSADPIKSGKISGDDLIRNRDERDFCLY
ncbi:hypothetical protein AVEN_233862-1, partial [Araneus ventricosus]